MSGFQIETVDEDGQKLLDRFKGLDLVLNTRHELKTNRNPGPNDDISKKFMPCSFWVNTSTRSIFICVNAEAGQASWTQVSESNILNNRGSANDPTPEDDSSEGYSIGSLWINNDTDVCFLCTRDTVGDAIWQRIGGTVEINDTGSDNTHTWSAAKIITLLATKSGTGHTHTSTSVTNFSSATDARISLQKGQPNGLAELDANGKLQTAYIPPLALTSVRVVANLDERNELIVQEGDVAMVTDNGDGNSMSYIHNGSQWIEWGSGDTVQSVNGLGPGAINLSTTEIPEGTNLYYTEDRVNNNDAVEAATAHIANSDNPHSVTKSQVGLSNVPNLKMNFGALTYPNNNNDATQGYSVGSVWIDIAENNLYTCVDSTAGVAIWLQTNPQMDMSPYDDHIADATKHRQISDGTNSNTVLWSGSYIGTQLTDAKARSNHTGTQLASTISDFTATVDANQNVQDSIDHIANTSNPHNVTKTQLGLGNVENIKMVYHASTAPTVDDDATDGYSRGSRWLDTTNDKEYVCTDTTAGAAVWVEVTNTFSNLGSGTGVWKQGTQFRSFSAASTKAAVTLNGDNITVDVVPTNIAIGDLSGAPAGTVVGTTDAQTLTNKTLVAANNTITGIGDGNLTTGINANKLADGSVSNAQFQYLSGVTSSVQTQLNAKSATGHTHAASDVTSGTFANARIAASNVTQHAGALNIQSLLNAPAGTVVGTTDAQTLTGKTIVAADNVISGIGDSQMIAGVNANKIADGTVSNAQFQYLSGVTSSVQTQLNAKSATGHTHAASDVTSGTFADARISESSVLQHVAAMDVGDLIGAPTGDVVGTTDIQTLTNKTIVAANNSITGIGDGNMTTGINANKIADGFVSNTEFEYLSGATSNLQTQISGKTNLGHSHDASVITSGTLPDGRVAASNVTQHAGSLNINSLLNAPSGTVVGTTDSQTLTNKTLTDSTSFFQDNLDNTKKMQFQLSSISTATIRTLTVPDANLTVVGTDTTQTLTNKTLVAANNTITGIGDGNLTTGINANKIADGSVSNVQFQYLAGITSNIQTQINGKTSTGHAHSSGSISDFSEATDARITVQKAVANGLATLDGNGKVPASQLALENGLVAKGTWNATTNTPTITSGVGTSGWFYIVNIAGTTSIDGISDWDVGDWILFDGAAWSRIASTNQVTSVAGRQGDIVLSASDIGSGTFANARIAASNVTQHVGALNIQSLLNAPTGTVVGTTDAQTLTNKTLVAANNTITGIGDGNLTTGINANKLADGSVSNAQFQYLSGVTSNVQTQLNAKSATGHAHSASEITSGTFANARITESSVTQHVGALDIQSLLNAPTGTVVGTTDAQTLTGKTIVAGNNTISGIGDTHLTTGINANKIADGSVSNAQFQYLSGVTSSVQTQLNAKSATGHVHGASDVTSGTFANARIAQSNVTQHVAALNIQSLLNAPAGTVVGTTDAQTLTNKTLNAANNSISNIGDGNLTTGINANKIADGSVSSVEFQYLAGATSSIQNQINGKSATGHVHAASDITSGTFTNARIAQSNVTQHQAAIDHGTITGLDDDDHTQYMKLDGRTGGQTLQGGNAAGNNLVLESTSHATKGVVISSDPLQADDHDAETSTTLLLGKANATGVQISKSGAATQVRGSLSVLEGLSVTGNIVVSGNVDGRDVSVDGVKLDGISSGATANDTDANLKARANHTGTQLASTISNFDVTVTSSTHATRTDNPHSVTKTHIGLSNVQNTKVNNAATSVPSATDDSAAGYSVGSRWINVNTDKEYVCVDSTASAAIWTETTNANSLVIKDEGSTVAGGPHSALNFVGAGVTVTNNSGTATVTVTATVNDTDANLKARANHTGTQLASTISNFDATVTSSTHANATTGHGATGAVMGTTNTQTVTNKTFIDSSTIIADSGDNTKQIKFDAAGTTSTSTTITSTQTVNRIVSLPDATDTLVGKNTTDVLTNKSLNTASCYFVDNADNTKKVAFNSAAATTGTTLTLGNNQTTSQSLALPNVAEGDTLMTLNTNQNQTGMKSFNSSTYSAGTASQSTTTITGSSTVFTSAMVGGVIVFANGVKAYITAYISGTSLTASQSQTVTNQAYTLYYGGTQMDDSGNIGTKNLNISTLTPSYIVQTDASKNLVTVREVPSGVFVGDTDTQTLSNKTFIDSSTIIADSGDNTKQIKFDAAGTTGTSTTITSSQTSNRVITLPNVTDTLVGKTTTDVLTNKSLNNTNCYYVDNSDNSKRIAFQSSGASTSTTLTLASQQTSNRTLSVPNITSSDTMAVLSLAQTMTNKIITDNASNLIARGLWTGSGSGSVSVYAAAAPSTGQFLVATSGNTATWQTLNINTGAYGQAYWEGIGTLTAIADVANSVKVAGTSTAGPLLNMTHSNNRLTYTGTSPCIMNVSGSITMKISSASQILGTSVKIRKNGSTVGAEINSSVAAYLDGGLSVSTLVSMSTGDYVEVWITNETSTESVNVNRLNLVASAIGGTSYDPPCTEASATGSTSTTSTAYTPMDSMSVTPAVGNYKVSFSASATHSASSVYTYHAIYVGGVMVAHSERTWRMSSAAIFAPMYTQAKVSVNGSQAIEIYYKTASGTLTVYERSMEVLKVA